MSIDNYGLQLYVIHLSIQLEIIFMYESLLPSSWHHACLLAVTHVHIIYLLFLEEQVWCKRPPKSTFPLRISSMRGCHWPRSQLESFQLAQIEFMQPKNHSFLALVDGKMFPVGDFNLDLIHFFSPSMHCWRDKLGKASIPRYGGSSEKQTPPLPHKGRPGSCFETHWVFNKLFSAKLRKSYFIWEVHKTTTESLFAAMKPSRNTFRWPCGWMEEFWKDSTYWATFPRGVTLMWQSLNHWFNILRLPSTIVAFQRNLP